MRRLIYLRIADRNVHVPKLIGAFVVTWAVLMVVFTLAVMFDTWDNVKAYDKCVGNIDFGADFSEQRSEFASCAGVLHDSTGIVARADSHVLTLRQKVQGLLAPIANLFFWLAIFLGGRMLYRSDTVILPIDERIRNVPDSRPVHAAAPVRSFAKRKYGK